MATERTCAEAGWGAECPAVEEAHVHNSAFQQHSLRLEEFTLSEARSLALWDTI